MKRTDVEILAFIEHVKRIDIFGVMTNDVVEHLPFILAKQFLSSDATEELWEKEIRTGIKPPDWHIKDYLPFAWDKANDCKGLSAGRSLHHLKAWMWLDGFDLELLGFFDGYNYYGKRQLIVVSVLYDFNWMKADDAAWVNSEAEDPLKPEDRLPLVHEATILAAELKAKRQLVAQ